MWLLLRAGLVLLLSCSVYSYPPNHDQFRQNPDLEWRRIEKLIGVAMPPAPAPRSKFWKTGSGSGSSLPEVMRVPEYVRVPASKVQKNLFKPSMGARPLPDSAKKILLVTQKPAVTGVTSAQRRPQVEILCHLDRIYVRARKELFKSRNASANLKLGTCDVNYGDADYFYHLYLLKTDCGWKRESKVDEELISITLQYKLDPSSPIVREPPFDIPIVCKYHRFFHSYKVGFYPKLEGGTIYRQLQPKSTYTLIPQDALGNELIGGKVYTLGQPMFFVAKQVGSTAIAVSGQRLYINKCFMTASQDSSSTPKYTVIDNQGCMIDGKATVQSKFLIDASSMVQKFQIGSFIFKDMAASGSSSMQLYMHCEMAVGNIVPCQGSKACNYDRATRKWKALYGNDSLCACCNSHCSSVQPKATNNMVSSHSWEVDFTSEDGYAEIGPQVKSLDKSNFIDHELEEDLLHYWDDYY
ncbi:zona pellucida sperm-binding protein 3 [Genypterus blacodes]|uniref:zona pellucida sperm-binding protein 3 n=1 Tax=Genypterus blacodes TaxID=154954 RepID=UPI003F777517